MNKKRITYIGILFIITVIVTITSFSYAFLIRIDEQHGKLNMTVGNLDYKIESDDLNNNSITLSANESKEIELTIRSLNQIDSKYKLYTNSVENVTIGYLDEEGFGESTGTISANGTVKVKIILDNDSDTSKTITFGVQGGFDYNEVALETGRVEVEEGQALCSPGLAYEFDYTGNVQEFTVRCPGTYKIELWGAQGGDGTSFNGTVLIPAPGYLGGYVKGNINLNSNSKLYLYVGGQGKDAANGSIGGYNGGGNGNTVYSSNFAGGGGAGATDIRYFSSEPTSADLNYNSSIGLNSRIMVAGGGNGGRNTGTSGGISSQTSGYQFGIGQNYLSNSSGNAAGGGAGGYYGSTQSNAWGNNTTNIGASSYISGHAGCLAIIDGSTSNPRALKNGCTTSSTSLECSKHYSGLYFTDTIMIDGSGYNWTTVKASTAIGQPQPDGTTATGHSGNGYARITYLGEYTYLIKDGVTNVDFTLNKYYNGGTNNKITNKTGYIQYDSYPGYNVSNYVTTNMVDVTNYKYLRFKGKANDNNEVANVFFISKNNDVNHYNCTAQSTVQATYYPYVRCNSNGKSVLINKTDNEYIIDVSDLTGDYYIGFASSNREMYIYDLVLYN